MRRRRSRPNVFGLAFLDIMSCGFGAVILFFMIINTGHDELARALSTEVIELEERIVTGRVELARLSSSLEETEQEETSTRERARELLGALARRRRELAALQQETLARSQHVNALKADLESLERDARRLESAAAEEEQRRSALREFVGDADRQYLTGLKVGGERIFILVDASASMLDSTIVNIVRRRNLSRASRRAAPKWRRAVASVDWLTTQIPTTSRFQIYTFAETAQPLLPETEGRWLAANPPDLLDRSIAELRRVVPDRGTSLHHAFQALASMEPPPDNIYLVTDGLPTRGASNPILSTVSADRRLKHFTRSLRELPKGIPVNVILFPMEGDPLAASSFWRIAQFSGGAFISPSEDWP